MAIDQQNNARLLLIVLGVLGAATVPALFIAQGLDVDGFIGAVWLVGVIALGIVLAVGLRLHETQPARSMVWLLVGALAPAVAWYNQPWSYVLTAAIAFVAFRTARPERAAPAAT